MNQLLPISPRFSSNQRGYRIDSRRLGSSVEFELIAEQNRLLSRAFYPHHESWIEFAVRGLKEDSYRHLAFGAFLRRYPDSNFKDGTNPLLVASCIVGRKKYEPVLEIKNLVAHSRPDSKDLLRNAPEIRSEALSDLVNEVVRFAERRGFLRVQTEIATGIEDQSELLKVLIGRNFSFFGSETNRVQGGEQFIHLAYETNPSLAYDSLDFSSKGRWILTRAFGEHPTDGPIVNVLLDQEGASISVPLPSLMLAKGSRLEAGRAINFQFGYLAIVIPPHLLGVHRATGIQRIDVGNDFWGSVFVLDFTPNKAARDAFDRIAGSRTFGRYLSHPQLENVLNCGESTATSRVGLEPPNLFLEGGIGGFLLDCNQRHIDTGRFSEIIKRNKIGVYVKLGRRGASLLPDSTVFFAHRGSVSQAHGRPEIYATAIVEAVVSVSDSGSGMLSPIEEAMDGVENDEEESAERIWDDQDVEKHNRFNSTRAVLLLYLRDFSKFSIKVGLREADDSKVEFKVASDKWDLGPLRFDDYLSVSQVSGLKEIAGLIS
jgi:hypothetical protein